VAPEGIAGEKKEKKGIEQSCVLRHDPLFLLPDREKGKKGGEKRKRRKKKKKERWRSPRYPTLARISHLPRGRNWKGGKGREKKKRGRGAVGAL